MYRVPNGAKGRGMAGLFRIFPEHNLVYVRYSGLATIADYISVVQEYPRHPDFDLHRTNLIDLRFLEDFERDYASVLKLQAHTAEYALSARADILSITVAPSQVAQEAAKLIARSWEGLETPVVRRIVPTMEEASTLIGINIETLEGLIKQVA